MSDPTALARAALAAWDLGEARVRTLRLTNNGVFAVHAADGRRFALRIHRPGYRSADETRSELVFLGQLRRSTGLSLPEPVPTPAGELVVLVADGAPARHCDLLTWLDGRPRRPGERPGLGAGGCWRLGELIGAVHAFSARFVPPTGFALPVWDADGLFTERSPYRPGPVGAVFRSHAERALFGEVERRARAAFAQLDGWGVIHADVVLGNVHWSGRAPGLLDFDDCGWGHFLYDLAPLVGNLMDYPAYPRLRTALLAGYRSVRPLPAEHEALLGTLVGARHAASCLWAAGNRRHGGGLTAEDAARHLDHRIAQMRRLVGAG